MREGKFTYYTFQHRKTHESPWLKPDEPLKPVEDKEWAFSNWDSFGFVAEPWSGTGNNYRPRFEKAHDETHNVWAKTGNHGWWTLVYAIQGLKRLQKGNEQGKFDHRDGYNNRTQAARYEFRIVQVTISKEVKVLHTNNLEAYQKGFEDAQIA